MSEAPEKINFSVIIAALKIDRSNTDAAVSLHMKNFVSNKIHWYMDKRPDISADDCRWKITIDPDSGSIITGLHLPASASNFTDLIRSLHKNRTVINLDLENCPTNQ